MWASSVSEAPNSAAFASFGNLRGYRDFLKLEAQRPTPKSACGRKRTSTAEYEYIGTLISRESFDSVTRVETYRLRKRIGKRRRWRVCGRLNGPYNKEQFSWARLFDAIASCERKWSYFEDMPLLSVWST